MNSHPICRLTMTWSERFLELNRVFGIYVVSVNYNVLTDRCTEGHGFDSRRGLRFFLCPTLPCFLISSPSLKFTIFLYLSPIGHLDIADPSSMQDACHHELSNMTYARHESPSSSVVRASDRRTEGHGFDSRRGLRFFLCPTLATC